MTRGSDVPTPRLTREIRVQDQFNLLAWHAAALSRSTIHADQSCPAFQCSGSERCRAVSSLLFVCPACAQKRSDFSLSHKDSREIGIRASETVMINKGTALLSTAAVRYAWCSQLVPAAQSPPRTLPSSRSMLHPCPVACRTHTRVRHTRLPERCAGGIEG